MSALHPKPDIAECNLDVRFVLFPDMLHVHYRGFDSGGRQLRGDKSAAAVIRKFQGIYDILRWDKALTRSSDTY
jgi:hypothetical protein